MKILNLLFPGKTLRRLLVTAAPLLLLGLNASSFSQQQPPSSTDRDRANVMLNVIRNDLKQNYYDPAFHGIDIDERFKAAQAKIKEATSLGQLLGIIAQTVSELDDSHTFFMPPGRVARVEYGWQMQMNGDKCYVIAVKPGSDAEAKGLRPGDLVYTIDGRTPTRENIWKLNYLYRVLRPHPGMRLVVMKPDGKQEQIDAMASVRGGKREMDLTADFAMDINDLIRRAENESRLHRHRYVEMGEDLFIWRMPEFDLEKTKVDEIIEKARKHKALVLDLRGNSGGNEDTLLALLGDLFDHEVKVGDLKRRKEVKPLIAKTRGHSFNGQLTVLIDSESGSAAELLARVVQLEKRGIVIGDRSAGAVMRARWFQHELGLDVVVPYGVSITDADIIMADGKSLEHLGVTPDEVKLSSASDLAEGRDPVLAYAASISNVKLSPEKAGEMFPIEWEK